MSQLAKDTLPWTWGAFVLAAITGALLFVSKASSYMVNPYFLWKMVMLALAGLNMMYFHLTTWRTVEHWELDPSFPFAAKLAGWLSLIFWVRGGVLRPRDRLHARHASTEPTAR